MSIEFIYVAEERGDSQAYPMDVEKEERTLESEKKINYKIAYIISFVYIKILQVITPQASIENKIGWVKKKKKIEEREN